VRHRRGPDGGWRGIEVDTEEERVHSVDSAVVREAIGEAHVVDTTAVSEAPVVQVWRRSRSRHAGAREMIVIRVRV
jgi:hypothetical protein